MICNEGGEASSVSAKMQEKDEKINYQKLVLIRDERDKSEKDE